MLSTYQIMNLTKKRRKINPDHQNSMTIVLFDYLLFIPLTKALTKKPRALALAFLFIKFFDSKFLISFLIHNWKRIFNMYRPLTFFYRISVKKISH
jgi:hypothetical protein